MNRLTKVGLMASVAGMILLPVLAYGQTSKNAVTTTIGYFYSASGQMMDAESNTGAMSSYLTRGERYDGSSETFAVSNIKDITADLDSNGNIINKYTYTAYGTQTSYTSNTQINESTISQLSLSSNPFTYDGYYTDSESGNYYLNARYYDPTLGIFLTSDSYNLPNRYMYVNGNPVMGTDPLGHIDVDIQELLKTHTVTARFEDKLTEIRSANDWKNFTKTHKGLKDFKFSFNSLDDIKKLDSASFSFQKNENQYIHNEKIEITSGVKYKYFFDSSKKQYFENKDQLEISPKLLNNNKLVNDNNSKKLEIFEHDGEKNIANQILSNSELNIDSKKPLNTNFIDKKLLLLDDSKS